MDSKNMCNYRTCITIPDLPTYRLDATGYNNYVSSRDTLFRPWEATHVILSKSWLCARRHPQNLSPTQKFFKPDSFLVAHALRSRVVTCSCHRFHIAESIH